MNFASYTAPLQMPREAAWKKLRNLSANEGLAPVHLAKVYRDASNEQH